MSFVVFLIYLLLTFVRPAERFPELQNWHLMEVASALALGAAAFSILTGQRVRLRLPQVTLLFLFTFWLAVTVALSSVRPESPWENVLGFIKSNLTAFLLVLVNVTTVRRMRLVAATLTISGIFLAQQAVSDYKRTLELKAQSARGDLESTSDTEWDDKIGRASC